MNPTRTAVASVALVLAGGAASADLLVTKEGATIETQGAWRVDGRRVIFTLPNGTLSSIRTDEVDLDRSALATARAAEAASEQPAPAAAPTAAPILRLSEADLSTVSEVGEVEIKPAEPAAAPQAPLQVLSWEQMPLEGEDGIQLFGTVRNNGTSHMTQVTLTAILYGEEGGMLANGDAQLNQTTIGPGQSANFRIEFPGLPDFASVKFNVAARGFETPPTSEESPETAPPAETPPPATEESTQQEAPPEPPPAS